VSRQAVVQSHLEVLMQEYLEVEELRVAPNGDIGVRTEESGFTARIRSDRGEPHLEVYSVVLDEVQADPGLWEALNGLNGGLTHCRVFWRDGAIVVAGELLGAFTALPSLECLIGEVVRIADEEAPQLHAVYGGRTWAQQQEET